jgi:DNA helicase II / ATP-dependent DNA helicase PcrA
MIDLNLLNSEQRKAVEKTDGPVLILAGAGSGKTRVLTYRIAYLIEKGVYPGNILAITFTNKAAAEMKERVAQIIGDEAKRMWISTFHSTCVRILRIDIEKLGYNKNFVIYDTSDQEKVIKECLKELNLDEKVYTPKDVLGKIGDAKDKLIDADTYHKRNYNDFKMKNYAELYVMYQRMLKNNNALDFDDIIVKAVQLLKSYPEILAYYQRKFSYIMVDEYQDTNKAQYEFVNLLASGHKNLCVVGDDDQSIYGWRGADIANILDFEKDYPNAEVIKLEQNYRSTKTILEAANCVIVNNGKRKVKRLWTNNEEGCTIKLYRGETDRHEVQFIISEVQKKFAERKDYNAFAILYRTNAMSRTIEEGFVKTGIPYKVVGGLKFYDRKEVKDILGYLRFINNNNDAIGLERIINTPKRGIGDTTIDKIKEFANESDLFLYEALKNVDKIITLSKRAITAIEKFTKLVEGFISEASSIKVSELINVILEKTGYENELFLENTDESKSRLENIKELYGAAIEFEEKSEDKSLSAFLEKVALVSDQDSISENGGVTLMTLHTAKGLEYPIVFIAGMEQGIFPHFSSMESNEDLEEERRICYVGITRAKEELYITSARQRMMFGRTMFNGVSAFVDEIPQVLIENLSQKKESFNRVYEYDDNKSSKNSFMNAPIAMVKPRAVNNVNKNEVRAGVKIMHKTFGKGLVIAIKETTGGKQITVQFDGLGLKNLILEASPIEVI